MKTIIESNDWIEITLRELEIGPEALMEEILEKRVWSNAEILWTVKRFIYYYGRHDETLSNAPPHRVFDNFASMMRAFYMIFDHSNPELDANIRAYISTKMGEATWGINGTTRHYLQKVDKRE
ncbi:MAG: hypothetical protein GXY50_01345 [Syntrophomonadaceae bacterium]|nr:hypothetical protein [Syntrophomonadaceae bacterium]